MPGTSPSRIELTGSSLAAHSIEPDTVPSGACKVTFYPAAFAVEIIQNTFGQGNGSAAWSIQLVYMVSFAHCYVVSRELVHDLRQIFVDGREYGYSQTEIR